MRPILVSILFYILPLQFYAQVTTNPALPIESQGVTISFDAAQGTGGLKDLTGDVYVHTGVITNKSTSASDWKYVVGTWGNNTTQPKLTREAANIYSLNISPDIRSFYKVPAGETIQQMAFVFRSADGAREGKAAGGKDIFVNLYTEGLNVSITSPSKINLFEKNQAFTFTSSASSAAEMKLFLNNQQIASQSGTSISQNITIPDAGNYWLKIQAAQNTTIKQDSVYVCIRETTIHETRPAALPAGINYIDDQTATLIVYAPAKQYIFVTGDFNSWLPDNNYQMKKDGDYFWVTVTNLTPQKEYAFQYLIDGKLQISDPYTEKVLDPYDDKYISGSVYPNLMSYPEGKAVDRTSVLQTAQTPFVWSTPTYTVPPIGKLSIYELLIRDFTTEKTYKAVQSRLDYLKRLGVNTIELMPVNEFEGNSSWGYNPNYYFAPDKAYGTEDDLKRLIDEAHKQGFIVIQDMVLNHSFNSSPMVKMYWNEALNRPAADNPWFNEVSPNPVYFWGSDFNHESQATRDFVDRVTNYWLTEYKVDGFRFDFSKGFTNTAGDGSTYDAARIANLKRMAGKIWEVNPKALVILEHFASNSEERELAAYGNGMLIWGNANYNFSEAAMGYHDSSKSDFNWASWQQRGFSKPGLVAYMESHDEERQVFKTVSFGNSQGDYNTKDFATAIDRSRLAATFFLSLTGPKMIWQFGELGYDVSINENGRIGEKPVRWNYLDDPGRLKLFNVYSAMLRLREQFDVFTSGKETLSLSGVVKKIQLTLGDHNITLIGNFGVADQSIVPNFQHSGSWSEFFTGQESEIANVSASIILKPGEFRLYSDQKLPAFEDLATVARERVANLGLRVFPNPSSDMIHISGRENIQSVQLLTMDGKTIRTIHAEAPALSLSLEELKDGLYFLRIQTQNKVYVEKIIKR